MNGSTIAGIRRGNPFNTVEAFSGEFRCIFADLRHSAGQSTGPLEIDRPWDAYTDDHLGLMDHLGIDRFMVLGFCIAGPFIWNLIERAPDRVVAAVPAQPVGFRPELPNAMYESQSNSWGTEVVTRRPEITTQMADQFLNRLFRNNPDFVFTVTRDFVRQCQTPVLVLPDDSGGHSYDAAIAEIPARLAAVAKALSGPTTPPGARVQLHNPPGSEVGPGQVATWGKATEHRVDAYGFQWDWAGKSSKHIPFDWTGPQFG